MSKKYKNPPIIEALCEFQFEPSQIWDLTVPGLVYEKISDLFPKKKQQTRIETQMSSEKGKVSQQVKQVPRIQFLSEDEAALVQLGPDLLTVNHLKPYPTWGQFYPLIKQNLDVYRDTVNPKGFKRIGLRYINKIIIETETLELADYFNFYPNIPGEMPQVHDKFISRLEFSYENARDLLMVTLGGTEFDVPDNPAFILDIDYAMVTPNAIALDQVEDWIEMAHTVIENTFEACITDKCRSLFGGEA